MRLVIEIGGEPVHVLEEQRALYHAALAHAANHLVTLVAHPPNCCSEAGVDDPAKVLRPLLTAALDNTLREGDVALTGPVARGDVGTVSAHIEAIGARRTETRVPTSRSLISPPAEGVGLRSANHRRG